MNKVIIKLGIFFFIWTTLLLFAAYKISLAPSKAIKEKEAFVKEVVQSAGGADAVLSACRKLLSEVKPFEGEGCIIIGWEGFSDSQVPKILHDMQPKNLVVGVNHVDIQLDMQQYRAVFLLAFRENTEQYGTSAITNGLWFWGGDEKDLRRRGK